MNKTKKVLFQISLIGLFLMTIIFTGCNNDDDDPKASNNLIGEWTIESSSMEMLLGDQTFTEYLMEMLSISEAEAEELVGTYLEGFGDTGTGSVTFNADNTYVADFGDGVDTGTWKLSSDGKTLTLDEGTVDESVVKVVSLTSSTLEIEISEESLEDVDGDGTDDEISIKISMKLKK